MTTNDEYFHFDFCLIRLPAFSINALYRLNDYLKHPLSTASPADISAVKEIFSNDYFKEAIYSASNELYVLLVKWLAGEELGNLKTDKLVASLHKYFSRMCTRSTPFGLFSGSMIAEISEASTSFHFPDQRLIKKRRLNMTFISELIDKLSNDDFFLNSVKFFPNDTLYLSGGKFKFTDYSLDEGKRRYTLSSFTQTPYLTKVIERAKRGASLEELKHCVRPSGADEQAISTYIKQLITSQVLVTEFLPSVTNENYILDLINHLNKISALSATAGALNNICTVLHLENPSLEQLDEVSAIAGQILDNKQIHSFQTDLFFDSTSANFNSSIIQEIVDSSRQLYRMSTMLVSPSLEAFKTKFSQKYEEEEIPLVQALDPEIGVGYAKAVTGYVEPMPLLDGLLVQGKEQSSPITHRSPLNKLIMAKYVDFLKNPRPLIELTEAECQPLLDAGKNHDPDNRSAFIFGGLISGSEEELNQGNFLFAPTQTFTPGAGRLMTRLECGSEKLKSKLQQVFDQEQEANPNFILAEVIYLPDATYANLALRPSHRQYEISYLCRSELPVEKQINIDDLYVSVKSGRVVLRSKRLNREIIPQITNSFNPFLGQPLYRFLSDVDNQNSKINFKWNWEEILDEIYLPRIQYKKIVLYRARWFFKSNLVKSKTTEILIPYFKEMRVRYNIPRYVQLSHGGDNELLIDMDSELGIQHLVQHYKKREIILYEFLQPAENCFITHHGNSYNNELIIPVGTRKPWKKPAKFRRDDESVKAPVANGRTFIPGSEWLFLKIYSGNKTLEQILVDEIKPFCASLIKNGVIDKWFFIRYNDPESHIRIRFHAENPQKLWSVVLPELNELLGPVINAGLVSRIVLDTYTRELERYGQKYIEACETIFYADSVAVTSFLDILSGENGELLRWKTAIYSVDRILNEFNLGLLQKQAFAANLQRIFFNEFGTADVSNRTRLEHLLNDRYRTQRPIVSSILIDPEQFAKSNDLDDFFNSRTSLYRAAITNIASNFALSDHLPAELNELLQSIIHMHLNRLFISRHRNHELVIYHYLSKAYTSMVAQEKREKSLIPTN